MKKTYQIPTTKVVKMQTVQMIAQSINMYSTNATSEGMSRQGGSSSWDDDDE